MATPTLLGYLAQFASFSKQAELLCTQGLTYLLQTHEDARSILADKVLARTGVAIGDSLTWLAEPIQADGGRPDLEAIKACKLPVVNIKTKTKQIPVVKIEAKLGAELLEAQLKSYAKDLRERKRGAAALLVLVPKPRKKEVARVTAKALDLEGLGPWPVGNGNSIGIAVIFWEDLFTALRVSKAEPFRFELEQLEAMYEELSDDYIAPLARNEDLSHWKESETDFRNLVNQVTRQLTIEHKIYPMGKESLEGTVYHRRYICSFASNVESCFSIGVRDPFEGWLTPVWMRFHKDTGNFRLIRQRIEASSLDSRKSSGHIWIPLDVPPEVSGEKMIAALIKQAEDVLRVARPAE